MAYDYNTILEVAKWGTIASLVGPVIYEEYKRCKEEGTAYSINKIKQDMDSYKLRVIERNEVNTTNVQVPDADISLETKLMNNQKANLG